MKLAILRSAFVMLFLHGIQSSNLQAGLIPISADRKVSYDITFQEFTGDGEPLGDEYGDRYRNHVTHLDEFSDVARAVGGHVSVGQGSSVSATSVFAAGNADLGESCLDYDDPFYYLVCWAGEARSDFHLVFDLKRAESWRFDGYLFGDASLSLKRGDGGFIFQLRGTPRGAVGSTQVVSLSPDRYVFDISAYVRGSNAPNNSDPGGSADYFVSFEFEKVPEPGTALLLVTGLAVFGLRRTFIRRRRAATYRFRCESEDGDRPAEESRKRTVALEQTVPIRFGLTDLPLNRYML